MELVFLFGTLKEGFPNFFINKGRRIGGDFVTADCYPLYLVSRYQIPWLMDQAGKGHRVHGQLFEVDADALADMDKLERVGEPDGYERKRIDIVREDDGTTRQAYIYVIPPARLDGIIIQAGPLEEYEQHHAAQFRMPPQS